MSDTRYGICECMKEPHEKRGSCLNWSYVDDVKPVAGCQCCLELVKMVADKDAQIEELRYWKDESSQATRTIDTLICRLKNEKLINNNLMKCVCDMERIKVR
jgi:hypothetical protein